jgi:hypothetical protein
MKIANYFVGLGAGWKIDLMIEPVKDHAKHTPKIAATPLHIKMPGLKFMEQIIAYYFAFASPGALI